MNRNDARSAENSRWPRVTIRDVALVANVSDATVSRVLTGTTFVAESTREVVLDAIRTTGYIRNGAARQLAGHQPNVVGLLIRDTRNPYYGRLNSELQFRSFEQHLQMLTITSGFSQRAEEEETGLQTLLEQRVRGIFVATGVIPLHRLTPISEYVPVVIIGRPVTIGAINSIAYDEAATGRLAADEVLQRGHRNVAVVVPPLEISATENPRAMAMIERLEQGGGRPIAVPAPTFGSSLDGIPEIVRLARDRTISAAMFSSDERMLAFLHAAQDAGVRVPEDVSVTGVDGVLPGIELLGLSTVRLPLERVALRATEVLREHLAEPGRLAPTRELYAPTFMTGRTLAQAN
jgi:DNA-binding LacI/PurR family transcriptional regulator